MLGSISATVSVMYMSLGVDLHLWAIVLPAMLTLYENVGVILVSQREYVENAGYKSWRTCRIYISDIVGSRNLRQVPGWASSL